MKIFRIIKIVCRGQRPLVGEECGVTHQPQMLEPLIIDGTTESINTEVPALGDSLS